MGYAETSTKGSGGDRQMDQWGLPMAGSNSSSGQNRFMSYLWDSGYELVYREDGSDKWKADVTIDPTLVDVLSK